MSQTAREPTPRGKRVDRPAQRLSVILEILQAISTARDPDDLLGLTVDRACTLLGVERCALFVVESRTAEELVLRLRHVRGLPEGEFERIRLGPGEGITAQVLAEGRTVWTDDILADARFPLGQETRPLLAAHDIRGILAAPVVVRGRAIGLFYAYPEAGRDFAPDEADLLSALALLVGIGLATGPGEGAAQERPHP